VQDEAAVRAEIERLRSLAKLILDARVLAAINDLILELELRLQRGDNGGGGKS
jgi:hypothetical protein